MVPTIENPCNTGQQRPSYRAHGQGHPDSLRSDSKESMRSAFYQGTICSTTEARNSAQLTEGLAPVERAGVRSLCNKGSSKHRSSEESQPAMTYRDSMEDVADMAIQSLGTDEIEALFGTSTTSPLRDGERREHHPWNDQTLPISNAASSYRNMRSKSGAFSRDAPPSLDTILWDTDRPCDWGPDTMLGKKSEYTTSWGSASPCHAEDSTLNISHLKGNVLDNFRSELSRFGEGAGESLLRHLPPVDPPAAAVVTSGTNSLATMAFSDYSSNYTSAPCAQSFPEEQIYVESAGTSGSQQTSSQRLTQLLDPTEWLSSGVQCGEDGIPFFDDGASWTMSGMVRHWIYNPIYPEFSSSQQFSWAIIIGIAMGFYTAGWKLLLERCVDFVWKDLPETLLERGFFTELEGPFPLYHYMWIVPAIFGGILSYAFAALPTPIPGQNEWIHNLHCRGVQSSETFGLLFILSTAGMISGLALGPELPLVLTSGMIGSRLAVLCKQSMLQARVLHLTAAAAAVGGFFGFPMAGALFVLEVPHRTGLQYFEALSPATIASIVAVLANRLVTGNDVTGYYAYPFLNTSLPSQIYTSAIAYGLFGAALGIFYAKVVLLLKQFVHDLFHKHSGDHLKKPGENDNTGLDAGDGNLDETAQLVGSSHAKIDKSRNPISVRHMGALLSCTSPHKPTRAGVVGILVGALVGTTGIFIPHVLFWGEAQLQTLIDKGRTPLPVFGKGDDPTADLLAKAYCIASHGQGFGILCSAAITLAKIFVTGLSLGLGIVGGHFWGPLFAGCAASHFLTSTAEVLSNRFGISSGLSQYPCVAILCIMGSAHVVTCKYCFSHLHVA
jgi:H+/Cl- antiporter ClcA